MIDDRTPEAVGQALANKLHDQQVWPGATPEAIFASESFEKLCRGRGYTPITRLVCERAIARRWRQLDEDN